MDDVAGLMGMVLVLWIAWRVGRGTTGGLGLDPWGLGVARVVIAFSCLVLVLTMLAATALLTPCAALVGFGLVLLLTSTRWRPANRESEQLLRSEAWGPWSPWLHPPLILAMVVTGWYWLRQTLGAATVGFTEFDSLHYHLPHAARMVQDGHLWAVNVVTPAWPVHFYPSNVELLQAAVLMSMRSDFVVALFGVVSLVLFVLVGVALIMTLENTGSRRAAVLGATGLLVLSNGGTIGYLGPGTAGNDLFVTAAVLAAVTLLVRASSQPRAYGIAGLAVGLAAGTKLTALVPAVALLVWVLVLARDHLRWALGFLVAALSTGGVWYLRNLLQAGNPIPGLDVAPVRLLFETVPFPSTQAWGTSIVGLGRSGEAWGALAGGWAAGHGVLWPLLVGLAAYGCIAGLRRGGAARAVGLVTVAAAVGYVITPWTAFGADVPDVRLVAATTRYALVPLSLGIVLAAHSVAGHVARRRAMAVALVISLAGTIRPLDAGSDSVLVAMLAAALVTVTTAAIVTALLRGSRGRLVLAATLPLVAVVGSAWVAGTSRYAEPPAPYTAVAKWANAHEEQEIGHAGWYATYLLYGEHRSNIVRSLRVADAWGEDGAPTTCEEFVATMRGFDAVVLGPWIRWADSYRAERDGWEGTSPLRDRVVNHPETVALIDDGVFVLLDAGRLPSVDSICSAD